MKLFQFTELHTVEGRTYGEGQIVAFSDDFDTTSLPGAEVASAGVFVEHIKAD